MKFCGSSIQIRCYVNLQKVWVVFYSEHLMKCLLVFDACRCLSHLFHASYTPRDVTKVLCVFGIGMHACAETKTQTYTCMCSLTC